MSMGVQSRKHRSSGRGAESLWCVCVVESCAGNSERIQVRRSIFSSGIASDRIGTAFVVHQNQDVGLALRLRTDRGRSGQRSKEVASTHGFESTSDEPVTA